MSDATENIAQNLLDGEEISYESLEILATRYLELSKHFVNEHLKFWGGIDRIPKTEDGKPMLPGMEVFGKDDGGRIVPVTMIVSYRIGVIGDFFVHEQPVYSTPT